MSIILATYIPAKIAQTDHINCVLKLFHIVLQNIIFIIRQLFGIWGVNRYKSERELTPSSSVCINAVKMVTISVLPICCIFSNDSHFGYSAKTSESSLNVDTLLMIVITRCAVDRRFESQSGQTNDY